MSAVAESTPPEPDEGAAEAAESPAGAEPENLDAERAEPIEGADEDAGAPTEDAEAAGGEGEAAPESAPPQDVGLSDKARKARDDKLDREKERHASRIGEIMGDEAVALIPCPVCMDGIDGWIFTPEVQQLAPAAISRIRQVIGLPDYTNFRAAPDAQECPDCGGLGEVTTGSHVPGYETKTCARCQKAGYVLIVQQTNGQAAMPEAPVMTGPTVYGTDVSADPEVQHLRERGFTVIPPMQPIAGT